MQSAVKQVRVIKSSDSTETIGPQRQHLIPCVTTETCGATGISAGMVTMAPGAVSKAHYHAHSEIVVVCLRGRAVTLIGPDLTPYFHGAGEFIYIPDGVVHVAVNFEEADDLVAVEMRTDPLFNDDVVLTPEYDARVPEVVARLRRDRAGS